MSHLTRWNPMRDVMSLRQLMNRMYEDAYSGQENEAEEYRWSLPLDVAENQNEYIVKASIPGIKPEDLDITYDNSILTIRGESKAEEEKKDERYHLRERRFGSFTRSISLPSTIRSDSIQASTDNGILTLRLPKTEEVKPRKITVQSGERTGQRTIEGNSN